MTRRSSGFALMMAIFLIVTLAAIGLYLVTITTGQVQAVSQDEQAVRAYQAARAGVEWGAFQRLRNSSCSTSTPLTFTSPGLSGFRAEVTCTAGAAENEGATPVTTYVIVSRGCNNNPCSPASPPSTYVERELQLTVTQ